MIEIIPKKKVRVKRIEYTKIPFSSFSYYGEKEKDELERNYFLVEDNHGKVEIIKEVNRDNYNTYCDRYLYYEILKRVIGRGLGCKGTMFYVYYEKISLEQMLREKNLENIFLLEKDIWRLEEISRSCLLKEIPKAEEKLSLLIKERDEFLAKVKEEMGFVLL